METTRTVVLPLSPDEAFTDTLCEAKRAYQIISEAAFGGRITSAYRLQKLVYSEVRAATGLTAQMTCSAIRAVAAAYMSAKSNGRELDQPPRFSTRWLDLQGGAAGRDFRIYTEKQIVSISTVAGRRKVSYRCGFFQRRYLNDPSWRVRCARLLYKRRKKGWRHELHVSLVQEVRTLETDRHKEVLGVDTGRRYLAVASTGKDAHFFKAGHLKPKKEHLCRLRGKLKSKGTRSAMRTYARISGREARLTRDFQHRVAKALIKLAVRNECGTIAVERLNGIRQRTGARGKKARYHHATWAYAQFLDILRYKAEGVGLRVEEVDPANTSRAGSSKSCGHIAKSNRQGLAFRCGECGYSLHADLNASRTIRLRAILDRQALVQDGPVSCGPEAESKDNGKLLA